MEQFQFWEFALKKIKRDFHNQFSGLQLGTNSLLLSLPRDRAYFPSPLTWTGFVTGFDCKI